VVDLKDYEDLLLVDNEKLEEAMTVAQNLSRKSFGKEFDIGTPFVLFYIRLVRLNRVVIRE